MDFINELSEANPERFFLLSTLIFGFLYGFIAQREQFCFSGGIKDFILFGQTKRTASLIMAILTAILATQYFGYKLEIDFLDTRYFSNVNYLFIVVGGILFGYGMMVSDGCSSRHLIKLASRDMDSLFVLLALGIFSFITYTALATFNEIIYSSALVNYFQQIEATKISLYFIVTVLVLFLFKSLGKFKNILQAWDGILIGLLVAFGWALTSYFINEMFLEETLQSLSFVYPLGKVIEYGYSKFETTILIFPVIVMIGVLIGAFVSSLFNKKYSKKQMCDTTNQTPPKLWHKMAGGACMGIGGMLAIGCTVGQGLSGLSTLSFASLVAIVSIYLSAYITAKYLHKNNSLIACFYFDFKS